MTIATQCEDRREMVRKLSEFLSQPAIYLRAPTYAFRIGGITVNRDTSVSGEPDQLTPVARFLLDNGYISEMPAGLDKDAMLKAVLENEAVKRRLEGKTLVKSIVVPGKLVNLVVK